MARVLVPLTKDVWAELGTGEMIITLHKAGGTTAPGRLLLNQVESNTAALPVTRDRAGAQFANTSATDTIYAKATGTDWEVVVDQ